MAEPGLHYLYRHYDACGCLLYVGITHDYEERDHKHEWTAPWYPLVARSDVVVLPGSRAEAEQAELEAIRAEQPAFNVMHRIPGRTREQLRGDYIAAHPGSL